MVLNYVSKKKEKLNSTFFMDQPNCRNVCYTEDFIAPTENPPYNNRSEIAEIQFCTNCHK